jgi:hypothetical protein
MKIRINLWVKSKSLMSVRYGKTKLLILRRGWQAMKTVPVKIKPFQVVIHIAKTAILGQPPSAWDCDEGMKELYI